MSKKPIIGGIILAAIIGVVFVGAQINPDNPENEEVVFHVTLADSSLYKCKPSAFDSVYGIRYCEDRDREFRQMVDLKKGDYRFRFVANGDSPEVLTVRIEDTSPYASFPSFKETFTLKGMPHESETSLYYTWSYDGLKRFLIKQGDMGDGRDSESFAIRINPNGNLMGPVSVDLIKLR